MSEVVVDVKDLAKWFKVSERAIYQMYQRGKLPKPIALFGRKLKWRESDITALLNK